MEIFAVAFGLVSGILISPVRRRPATSMRKLDGRAHAVDNRSITDCALLCPIGAIDPTLTIIANALCVADILKDRL